MRQRRTAAVYRSRRLQHFPAGYPFRSQRQPCPVCRRYDNTGYTYNDALSTPIYAQLPHRRKPVLPRWYRTLSYRKLKGWQHCQNLGTYNLFRSSLSDECRDKPAWISATNRSALTLFGADRDHFKSTLTKATTPITILATVRNNTSPWAICAWLFRTVKKKY